MRRLPLPARVLVSLAVLPAVLGACDRAKSLSAGGADAAEAPAGPRLDLSARPTIVFQIFGERGDPRMIPVAAVVNGALQRIELDPDGWRKLDATYMRAPATVRVYQDGDRIGEATVRQGMWEKAGEPLYTLPACEVLTPLAAVSLGEGIKGSFTVEFLATTADIPDRPAGAAMPPAQAEQAARDVAYGVGARASIAHGALDSLDFRAVAVHTGATPHPTLVASFIDDNAAGTSGNARHVFIVADRVGDRYAGTYSHAVNGAAGTATYRRYVDHLDVTGDGIDEIFLEGWQAGGDTYLIALGFRDGEWSEVYRGRSNWCLDRKN